MAKAVQAVKELVAGTRWAVVLSGSYGCGKTHLAYAAMNAARESNQPYKFVRANDLMKQLRDAINESKHDMNAMSPDDWIAAYSRYFLLALDDLGAHQSTDWSVAALFDILDTRYRMEAPTLITTNLQPQHIDARLLSRYRQGVVVCMAPDYRNG